MCEDKASSVFASIPVVFPSENATDVCSATDVTNTADFEYSKVSKTITNTVLETVPVVSGASSVTTTFEKKLPSADIRISGP